MSSLSLWQVGAALKGVAGTALVVAAMWGAIRMGWGIDGQAEHDKAMALSDKRCRRRYFWRDAALMKSLRAIERRGRIMAHTYRSER